MTFDEARALADDVRAAGWTVTDVLGDRPGGPPRTRGIEAPTRWSRGGKTAGGIGPWDKVHRVPAVVKAVDPFGRPHNVGSRRRWESLKVWIGAA